MKGEISGLAAAVALLDMSSLLALLQARLLIGTTSTASATLPTSRAAPPNGCIPRPHIRVELKI